MIFSARPPIVSRPSDSGITSSSSQSSPLAVAGEHVGLDRRAERDHLVGIEVGQRRLAEELGDRAADLRHARRAADQHDAVDVGAARARRRAARVAPAAASSATSVLRDLGERRRGQRRGRSRAPSSSVATIGAASCPVSISFASRAFASSSRVSRRRQRRQLRRLDASSRTRDGRSRRRRAPNRRWWRAPRTRPRVSFRIEMSNVPPPRS